MSEMVERVARTICAADYEERFSGVASDDYVDRHVHNFIRIARSAINSLKEPTDGMIEAVDRLFSDAYRKHEYSVQTKDCWNTMIDEALK